MRERITKEIQRQLSEKAKETEGIQVTDSRDWKLKITDGKPERV